MTAYQAVFNVTQGVDSSGFTVYPGQDATHNTENLRYMVSKLLSSDGPTNGKGGTLQFPSAGPLPYQFNGTITIGPDDQSVTQPYSVIFEGTGLGSLSSPLMEMTASADLFVVNTHIAASSDQNIGGALFKDLQIFYASGTSSGAAVKVVDSQNVRVLRVVFQDCPEGVVFQNATQCVIEECTFVYVNQLAAVGVTIDTDQPPAHNTSSNQIVVKKSILRTRETPNTCIGIAVYACKHATIETMNISGLNNAILLSPTTQPQNNSFTIMISDCQADSLSAALTMKPQSSSGSALRDVRVQSCSFTQTSGQTYTGAGIVIDLPTGGSNSQVDTIKLIGVMSEGWQGHGLQINGGQNIQIIGGTYAGNMQGGVTTAQAGLAITGAAANISVVGADFSATYQGSTAQQYALLVSGSPTTPVLIKTCFMPGYSASPVSVTGSPSNLQINDCSGYNDQNTPLNGGSAPSLTLPKSAATSSTPYFGPSLVTFSNASTLTVHVIAASYSMNSGSVYLAQPLDNIGFSASPSAFTWLGK